MFFDTKENNGCLKCVQISLEIFIKLKSTYNNILLLKYFRDRFMKTVFVDQGNTSKSSHQEKHQEYTCFLNL